MGDVIRTGLVKKAAVELLADQVWPQELGVRG